MMVLILKRIYFHQNLLKKKKKTYKKKKQKNLFGKILKTYLKKIDYIPNRLKYILK
jgi:hypothetical protein